MNHHVIPGIYICLKIESCSWKYDPSCTWFRQYNIDISKYRDLNQ